MIKINRITPAHAGKSTIAWSYEKRNRDHPRTRGEKYNVFIVLLISEGSPPHTRGKVALFVICIYHYRITPAHAGKSHVVKFFQIVKKDHPRTRGEKFLNFEPYSYYLGSPPHTRGKAFTNSGTFMSFRITPAHAGKSYYPFRYRNKP